jgi:16S rRNA (cytosine1402-N4)-methyltransferase
VADRATVVPAVFDELPEVLDRLGLPEVQAVLFDLGVSSLQLDRPERGFSYATDAPLDMRMDPSAPRTAADVVNTYATGDLARVLRVYGEERFATRIAAAITRERERAPFTHTERLAHLVRDSIPAATRRTGGHPAKRTFQALRIEVNDELGVLERALPAALDALAVGAGSPSSPSTPSRTASSSGRSRPVRWTARRRSCRCRCPSWARRCGC